MRTVYGPFRSWRMGRAIGVDPICRQPKVCNLKCVYCRLGNGGIMVTERSRFVDENQVRDEAKELLQGESIDAVEFRGTGEPFLAKNLHEINSLLRALTDVPFGIVTNGSMLDRPDVIGEMNDYDVIIIKLDAADQSMFSRVNRPHSSIKYERIIESMRRAVKESDAEIRIQITFMRGNLSQAENIAFLIQEIGPELIYLSTPMRLESVAVPKKELIDLARLFHDFQVRTIYDELGP